MLLGEFDHTIDDKNRLTLPARFREAFAAGVVVTRGLEGCLSAYPREQWERMVTSWLDPLNPFSKEARQMHRYYYAGASEDTPDKQGRVTIPAALLQHAALDKEVVVAGVGDRAEIWDRATWRKQLKEVEGSAEHVAERLAAKLD
jgi:MraZ protein